MALSKPQKRPTSHKAQSQRILFKKTPTTKLSPCKRQRARLARARELCL